MKVWIALCLIIIFPCSFNLNLKFLVYFDKFENSSKEVWNVLKVGLSIFKAHLRNIDNPTLF